MSCSILIPLRRGVGCLNKYTYTKPFSTTTSGGHRSKQNRIPAAYYRGGTSRGIIFHKKDLPARREDWAPIFLGVIGSPDPNGRQLDGLGGGVSSLSKICVVAPSSSRGGDGAEGAEVEFTFVQVGVKNDGVDYSGNCGNLTSAIGPFAVDEGIVKVHPDPESEAGSDQNKDGDSSTSTSTTIRIYNTNTGKVIDSTFPVTVTRDGGEQEAVASGDFSIDGVSGTASKIQLDFLNPAGSKTGKMLPTGNIVDVFDGVRTTCVDVGNPTVFLQASDLDVDGTILPDQMQDMPGILERLESIRVQASVAMGMAKTYDGVPASIPKICFVSSPVGHKLLSGEWIEKGDVDVAVRAISVGQPHRALPITSGLGLAVAARLEGSVVKECVRDGVRNYNKREELVIGHSSGKLVVGAKFGEDGVVERATVYRTARRLMDGYIYWK